jgi:hypothetical protein
MITTATAVTIQAIDDSSIVAIIYVTERFEAFCGSTDLIFDRSRIESLDQTVAACSVSVVLACLARSTETHRHSGRISSELRWSLRNRFSLPAFSTE